MHRHTHPLTHADTDMHRGEALISGRKEYNEWVIKTQGRIAANLWPLLEHRSHDKGRISARRRRQAACAYWGDEMGSISAAIQCWASCTDCYFLFSYLYVRTNFNFSNYQTEKCIFTFRFIYLIALVCELATADESCCDEPAKVNINWEISIDVLVINS